MAKTFHLTVAKVGENLYDGEAVAVHLPGSEGDFTVLAGHEAFVTELKLGKAKIESPNGEKIEIPLEGGVAEVSGGQATILL
jgi:F-type H+-transporting ATPase subunit epsilon